MKATMLDRFVAKVAWPSVLTACWLWTAGTNQEGYGTFHVDMHRRKVHAHRVAYELARGPVPTGLVTDHLCRVRRCVNPAHLEAVTDAVNLLRGESFSRYNAEKTHCVNGHPFDAANTYTWRGYRHCRTCRSRHEAKYKRRVRSGGA